MAKIIDKDGCKYLELTKKEFDENYIVGCLSEYSSTGDDDCVVRIKIYGDVPSMKHCVLRKIDNGCA